MKAYEREGSKVTWYIVLYVCKGGITNLQHHHQVNQLWQFAYVYTEQKSAKGYGWAIHTFVTREREKLHFSNMLYYRNRALTDVLRYQGQDWYQQVGSSEPL